MQKWLKVHSWMNILGCIWTIFLLLAFAGDIRTIIISNSILDFIFRYAVYFGLTLFFIGYFLFTLFSKKFFTNLTKIMLLTSLGVTFLLTVFGNKIFSDILGMYSYIDLEFALFGGFLGILGTYKKKIFPFAWVGLLLILMSHFLLLTGNLFAEAFGVGIGFCVSYVMIYAQHAVGIFSMLAKKFLEELEYRRQLAHFLVGAVLSIGIYIQIFPTTLLAIVALVGGTSVFFVKRQKLVFLKKILGVFERDHHMEKFPGRGVFYFVVGAFLTSMIFGKDIASVGILILSIGDSITNIVGKDFGHLPLFYNPKKNMEGPVVGAMLATVGASLYIPFHYALFASSIAMFVESLPLKIKNFEIDDNVTIPLAAGLVIYVMKLLGI